MTVTPTIRVDKRQQRVLERTLEGVRDGVPRATDGAIKKTGRTVRTRVRRATAKNLNVTQKELKQESRFNLDFRRDGRWVVGAKVSVTGGRLPLKRFAPRQTKRGVSFRARGGGRKTITSAFISRKLGGQVFSRVSSSRLPIVRLDSASAPEAALNDAKVRQTSNRQAPNLLQANLDNQVDRLLKRSGRGSS